MENYVLCLHEYLKDQFDPKSCVMPTLVENHMTNKPMGLNSL